MPRSLNVNEWDSPEAQWAGIRWAGAAKQAFNGARGQALLKELEAALLAMPAKRLIAHEWAADGDVCSLGALDVHRMVERTGMNWDAARLVVQQTALDIESVGSLDEFYDDAHRSEVYWEETNPAQFAKDRLSMTFTLAWEIIYENDDPFYSFRISPEQRYRGMLKWVQSRIHVN